MPDENLSEFGIQWLEDDQISAFLSNESVGVLALPTSSAPAMRPMSYWFDGESRLYFYFVLVPESEKEALSKRADAASFLVFDTDTPFTWTSVLLTGTIRAVSGDERDAVEEEIEIRWRPEVFEQATTATSTRLYALDIDERAGMRQRGLPPGFDQVEE